MSGKTLHLFFTDPGQIAIDHGDKFVISEDLDKSGNDWFVRFAEIDISDDSIFSYDVFWPYLAVSSRGNLLIYAELYSELSNYIEQENITHLVSHNLKKEYRLVAEDLGNEYGIAVEHKRTERESWFSTTNVLFQFSVVLLFVDQILSLAKEKLFSTPSLLQDEHLFFPYPSRYDSMLPVIQEMEQPSNIIVTPLTISWRLLNPVSDWPGTDRTKTLTEFADLSTIKKQVRTLFSLQKDLLTDNLELGQNVDEQLRADYGVQLSRTVEYVCQDILEQKIRLILSLHLIEDAIERTEPSSVIVGGMNPRDRYALIVGGRVAADLHYIPHSIVLKNEIVPPVARTTHFVAGPADEQMLRETYSEESLPNIVPTGRPYLDNLSNKTAAESGSEESSRVILGTQPYPDWIRRKFVTDALETLGAIEYSGEVIIKIHPSESKTYYSKIVSQLDHELDINVEDGDIGAYVSPSSILLTINSNVGIEGIILGAFCIAYNPFEPFVNPSSYISGEQVPYVRTIASLRSCLKTTVQEQKTRELSQIENIQQLYTIGDSKEKMAELIENRN